MFCNSSGKQVVQKHWSTEELALHSACLSSCNNKIEGRQLHSENLIFLTQSWLSGKRTAFTAFNKAFDEVYDNGILFPLMIFWLFPPHKLQLTAYFLPKKNIETFCSVGNLKMLNKKGIHLSSTAWGVINIRNSNKIFRSLGGCC